MRKVMMLLLCYYKIWSDRIELSSLARREVNRSSDLPKCDLLFDCTSKTKHTIKELTFITKNQLNHRIYDTYIDA